MQASEPSRTAMAAAAHRAAHQSVDGGAIFSDPYARRILGEEAAAEADLKAQDPATRSFRLVMAARSRYAEDCLAHSLKRGVAQAVILGAGLDTFALRNPHPGLKVFEVDHPATQGWKQTRLREEGLTHSLPIFVPIDFEREDLETRLVASGFRPETPAFFIWLGVVPYLREAAVFALLTFVAGLPGASIVFDYGEPLESYPPERRARAAEMAARTAAAGEPWLTRFDPPELAGRLRALGFIFLEDLGPTEMAKRFFGLPQDAPNRGAGPHIICAGNS
ncbi:class I SAM-dependent methyltransferase [Rhizobium binae]|uniref:class I SAM-dependent methyltransferase n=1 Tax=Rhizobium binae TaxID=1138190 RepID=UPI001C8290A1|nr:SAM-dependent methyltransferase [Rhizobium binae]MBX4927764.1 SAM-dependent methyltransferase [Rhizobium binae]MBX4948520.1 SAM-dependent methyltransferase [Rhizobium binae]MBX4960813.1 SAM-dependent methyltransferase [Rhizobium binae]